MAVFSFLNKETDFKGRSQHQAFMSSGKEISICVNSFILKFRRNVILALVLIGAQNRKTGTTSKQNVKKINQDL